jgi:hypothetical protein
MNPKMDNQEPGRPTLDQNLQEIYNLKIAAMGMLLDSRDITPETRQQLKDIFDEAHTEKSYLLTHLANYLSKKNPKIFEADNLTRLSHEIGKSASINNLHLSAEDTALLEWFQQVRM